MAAEGDLTSLPPLGPGFLAASINRSLPGTEVVLAERPEQLLKEAPGLVGISANTDNYALAVKWAKSIKAELGVPVILGGIHISMAPGSLDKCFDLAVIGEGELTLVEALRSYMRHSRFDHSDLAGVPGLAFYRDGRLHSTPEREPVADLAQLPLPSGEMAPYYRGKRLRHIFSARGCPYRCDFCSSSRLFSRHRALPAGLVVEEIERLVLGEGAERIVFYDDLFIADKRRLSAIAAGLEERGLTGKCRFSGSVRADLIDEETCRLLARIGMDQVAIGLESFSDKVLAFLNKTGLSGEINQRALDLLAGRGIGVLALLMFGVPVETAEDINSTLEKICRNAEAGKIRDAYWAMLAPYPGTKTWDQAKERGLVGDSMDWSLFAGGGSPALYLGMNVSRDKLCGLIDEWRARLALARPGPPSSSRTSLFH